MLRALIRFADPLRAIESIWQKTAISEKWISGWRRGGTCPKSPLIIHEHPLSPKLGYNRSLAVHHGSGHAYFHALIRSRFGDDPVVDRDVASHFLLNCHWTGRCPWHKAIVLKVQHLDTNYVRAVCQLDDLSHLQSGIVSSC